MRLTQATARQRQAASEMMERQVGQMVRLVDDLLDVSRISRGKIELRRRAGRAGVGRAGRRRGRAAGVREHRASS